MSEQVSDAGRIQVGATDRVVATAIANRVASVNTIFFGRLYGVLNTDRFDINQGIELMWREYSGLPRASDLRRSISTSLPGVRRVMNKSSTPGREAVHLAVDAIEALLDERLGDRECIRRVVGSAVGVALYLDDAEVEVPDGFAGWASFELSAEAAYFDLVKANRDATIAELAGLLRSRSGEDSMVYRYAMKDVLR